MISRWADRTFPHGTFTRVIIGKALWALRTRCCEWVWVSYKGDPNLYRTACDRYRFHRGSCK